MLTTSACTTGMRSMRFGLEPWTSEDRKEPGDRGYYDSFGQERKKMACAFGCKMTVAAGCRVVIPSVFIEG